MLQTIIIFFLDCYLAFSDIFVEKLPNILFAHPLLKYALALFPAQHVEALEILLQGLCGVHRERLRIHELCLKSFPNLGKWIFLYECPTKISQVKLTHWHPRLRLPSFLTGINNILSAVSFNCLSIGYLYYGHRLNRIGDHILQGVLCFAAAFGWMYLIVPYFV